MYSRVVFWRRYVLGKSEERARSQPLNPTLELYVKCYFETDFGQLRLARLRLRREIGRMLWIDKIAGWLSKFNALIVKKLLIMFLEKLVAWMRHKVYEDTISDKEAERMWREIEKLLKENKVK